MPQHHKLSLTTAILININIMVGAGIFVNTTELAKQAGALGALSYGIIGILLLPLILSIKQLITLHPTGGFYRYGAAEINPFAGFLGTWSYIIAKLASAMLMIHVSVLFLQQIIPAIRFIHPMLLDIGIVSLFIFLNTLHVKTGSMIQTTSTLFKLFPVFFAVLVGLILFQPNNLSEAHLIWEGIPGTLPLVLFAMLGFEAACSLSSKIEHPEKNASRALLISYVTVIIINCLYQLCFYGALGSAMTTASSTYHTVFPTLISHLIPSHAYVGVVLIRLLHIAIASSALSSSYSIIFSNLWNIYTLAQHNHLFGSRFFTQLNKHHIPWLCVLAEGIICLIHLAVTQGNQIPLQVTGALGCTLAYTMSVTALLYAQRNGRSAASLLMPLLGLSSCLILLSACTYNLIVAGMWSLISYSCLLALGVIMFWYTQQKTS